jgi:hypothetical protein
VQLFDMFFQVCKNEVQAKVSFYMQEILCACLRDTQHLGRYV